MAYTFLKASGYPIGKSLCEDEYLEYAKKLLIKYDKIILPIDHIVSKSVDSTETFVKRELDDDDIAFDIGPDTIELFSKYIKISKTIIWNGPVGMFENKLYEKGTKSLCEVFDKNQTIIIGGGDTASAIINLGYSDRVSHISTGGGASLELLEGKTLPAIKAIEESK